MSSKEEIVKERMNQKDKFLSIYSSKNIDSIRFNNELSDIRPNYFRDTDRIIHSLSYTRYIDKTQVFSNTSDDNISKRIIHVQLVSKIARTIGRALNLNEDLIEAIALGHDIGHVPFGHTGEFILNKISLKNNEGIFAHNVQGVRTYMNIENNGRGNNLSIQTLDGILCHNGEFVSDEYYPKQKTKEEFLEEYNLCYKDDKKISSLIPMTLEGCVVRISDIIGYLGRDIEDAIELGVFDKKELPKNITDILGNDNKNIVNNIILDIIDNSLDKPYIKMSKEVYNAVRELKKFNYENIYSKANTKEKIEEYDKMFNTIFEYYLNILNTNKKNENIYVIFLNNKCSEYIKNTSNARKIIDYISGMTDEFLITEYKMIKNSSIQINM